MPLLENKGKQEMERLRSMLGRQALKKWTRGCDTRSCNKWREEVRRSEVVGRAILKWLHKLLSTAFEGWYESHQEKKRLRIMEYKAVKMWVGMMIGRAWRWWDTMVMDKKRLQALAGKCIGRWRHQALARA